MDANELGDLLIEVPPLDGSTLGNLSARQALRREFQGWFSNDWDDVEVLWLQHFQQWGNQ